MANHAPFDIEENEIQLLARTGDRMVDQARMFDPGSTAPQNLPEGAVRLNLSARKFEKLGPGGVWEDALDYMAMKVNELQSSAVLQVLQAAYPVGSVYINANVGTSPATLLGFGTWTSIGAGRVLVGQDTGNSVFDVLGETGGTADAVVVAHTHSISDPGHSHAYGYFALSNGVSSGSGRAGAPISSSTSASTTGITGTNSAGVSGVNANLPPYLVVKMWKRTA
ncbi:phage baseplate protein [Hylemonella sp. W303a]|uniref:phage baseplate protein n=1 Tax=Hylemonella sp. W303a TaxID=3389873 RepID=UPI00396B0996